MPSTKNKVLYELGARGVSKGITLITEVTGFINGSAAGTTDQPSRFTPGAETTDMSLMTTFKLVSPPNDIV